MSPAAGTRLGSYEVLSLLGKGGMGEVYRALDRKLGREVALKLLPEDLSHDGERLQRFEREARILASLNHPNIATLHGLEESNGQHFLIMELVPGETLAERISRGRVPLDEAIPLFRQIAEALEAAHEKGIIHRDLKPANVKITPEGKVRVLDFGLAKVFEDTPLTGDLSHSPTVTREATRMGTVMGTAAYMSPEQTRGKRLDRRSDMWGFGCCLFEALSGSKAFDGETVTDVFAAIVRGEPDWSRLPNDVPASVRLLLERCLTKDVAHRIRDAGDAALELEDALKRPAAPARPQSSSAGRNVVAVGLGIGLLALGIGIGSQLPRADSERVRRFEVNLPEGLTLGELEWPIAALSPDGERLALVARSPKGRDLLYLRTVGDGTTVPIPGTEGASIPFFSPDGHWIGFNAGGWLKKVAVRGGAPVPLCEAVIDFGATWGEDDTIVFRENTRGLVRVSASGGERTPFADGHYTWPAFLPGGKSLLVEQQGTIAVVSLETGEAKKVTDLGRTPRYVRSGHLVYEYDNTLYAAAFDLETLDVRGTAVPVGATVRRTRAGPALYDVAADGSLVYLPGVSSASAEKSLVWVDTNGTFQPITETRRAFRSPRLSPEGDRLALEILEGAHAADVWIHDLGRDTLRRITVGGNNFFPTWMPDGRKLTYSSQKDDIRYLSTTDADASGEPQRLLEMGDYVTADSWSPDGKMLLYSSSVPDRGWDQFLLSVRDGSSRTLVSTPEYDAEGAFSPDGKWVLYASMESGVLLLYVQALAEPGRRWQISDSTGRDGTWTSGGKEIVYRSGRRIMSVSVRTEPDFDASAPRILFEGPFEVETNGFRNFDVTRDGRRFVMIHSDEGPLDRLAFVVNWDDELRRLVPP